MNNLQKQRAFTNMQIILNTYPRAYSKQSMDGSKPCRSNLFAELSPNDRLLK